MAKPPDKTQTKHQNETVNTHRHPSKGEVRQSLKPTSKIIHLPGDVRGINSKFDDIATAEGDSLRANIAGGVIDARLERSIDNSTSIEIDISDPDLRTLRSDILQEAFKIQVDDLWFQWAAIRKQGTMLTLVFEDEAIARLRQVKGFKKAYRDQVTRAEFIKSLVDEVKHPKIPTFIPELHVKQPVVPVTKTGTDTGPRSTSTSGARVPNSGTLTRVQIGQLMIAAGFPADVGVISEGIAISSREDTGHVVGQLQIGGGGGVGLWQLTGAHDYDECGPCNPPSKCADDALAQTRCAFAIWKGQGKQWSPAWTTAPYASKTQFADEARKAIELGAADGSATGTTETTIVKNQRYAYERKKKEDTWACSGRLADEVQWKRFVIAGTFCYLEEPELMNQNVFLEIDRDTVGIDNVDFDIDDGKDVQQLTITAWANHWAAPPGTKVELQDHGIADDEYIIDDIQASFFSDQITVTASRPLRPKREPATTQNSRTISGTTSVGGSATLQKMVAEADRMDALHKPYVSGGGHESPPSASGGWDCSGAVSRVLYVGGFLKSGEDTVALGSFGHSGPGKEVTLHDRALPGSAGHVIIDLGGRFFGTSGSNPGGGAGWIPDSVAKSEIGGLPTKRHPPGM
jgi:hypothetical protein